MSYNIYLGGVDGADETRLHTQVDILSGLEPDIVCLQECTWGDEDNQRRLEYVANALGLRAVAMVRSHTSSIANFTTLLYRPSRLKLIDWQHRGKGAFLHTLIRARFRPVDAADDDHDADFLVLGTHLNWTDGESRLQEVRWMTDDGDALPGTPQQAFALGDFNTPDREPKSWSLIPRNLHSRYRLVKTNGRFGKADRRAVRVLLASGWQDPQKLVSKKRAPTVGYYYPNEPVPWCLDYALVRGVKVIDYRTVDTPQARAVSDHLPVVLDAEVKR
ncbi:endonuclease/exonuclease/phosphatase family protein [Streptomyces decoyicus]|uniref:endonuclease/exonuclease/phosphatase family protein n=1 Tax=Streptomyces decoyicus TaxID=249567 RepID=UPI00365763C8